jgi:cytochrome c-type biogenesis protein CcmH
MTARASTHPSGARRGALGLKSLLPGLAVLAALMLPLSAGQTLAQSVDDETRRIAQDLQCPVCEGLSVADSPSQLAVQMRTVIREKLTAGEGEDQIRQYFVDRYGETVLRVPPRSGFTAIVWIAPYIVLGVAVVFLVTTLRRRKGPAVPQERPAATGTDPALDAYLEEVDRTYQRVRDEALR